MTATAERHAAAWTAPDERLRALQLEKVELADLLVQRPSSTLDVAARHRIAQRLIDIDDELIDVRGELAEERRQTAPRTKAEREAARTDHQHLCAEIVQQWREQKRLAERGIDVPAPECFRPGQGRGSPPIGAVWTAVRQQWDVLRDAGRVLAERRAGAPGA